jgi:hypothetical protein
METHRAVRRRGSYIFYTIGPQMAVRLSALRPGRPLPPGRSLVLISVRGCVDARAIVRLEGLGQLKYPIGNRTCDLPSCSIMPQPTTLPRVPMVVTKTKLRGLSQQANYTDRATAACRRSHGCDCVSMWQRTCLKKVYIPVTE